MKKTSYILLHVFIILAVIGVIAEEFVMPKQKRSSTVKKLQKSEQQNDVTILQKAPDILRITASVQEQSQDELLHQVEGEKQSKDVVYLTKKVHAQNNYMKAQDALVAAGNALLVVIGTH